jgi:hypothetical protein
MSCEMEVAARVIFGLMLWVQGSRPWYFWNRKCRKMCSATTCSSICVLFRVRCHKHWQKEVTCVPSQHDVTDIVMDTVQQKYDISK